MLAEPFKPAEYPGHFLRHKDFKVVIEKDDGSDRFRADASFKIGPPVGGPPAPPAGGEQPGGGDQAVAPNGTTIYKEASASDDYSDAVCRPGAGSGFVVGLDRATARPSADASPASHPRPPTCIQLIVRCSNGDDSEDNVAGYVEAGGSVTIVGCSDGLCEVSAPKHGFVDPKDIGR